MCYARDSNLLLNNTASIYVYKGERHTDTSVWWGDPRVKIRNLWLKEGSQGKKVFRWLFFSSVSFPSSQEVWLRMGQQRRRQGTVPLWYGRGGVRSALEPPLPPSCHTRRRERRGGGGGIETSPPLNALCLLFSVFFSKSNSSCSKRKCLLFIFWKHLAFGTKIIIRG